MTTNQKNRFLYYLNDLADRIEATKKDIADGAMADSPFYTSNFENISAYATRIRGYYEKRDGICLALNVMGYLVKWENNRPVDIVKMEE